MLKQKIKVFILMWVMDINAHEIKISKMINDGVMERSFILKTNLTEKVVIDCQSFIMGLRIGENENASFHLLDPDECENLQRRMRLSLKKKMFHCIDITDGIRFDRSCL
jgi:hypothetical protein